VKVGYTLRLAEDRANELFTTGLPTEFKVEFRACTSYPQPVEKRAHEILDYCRIRKREFFITSIQNAIEAVRQALAETAGIAYWAGVQPVVLSGYASISLNMLAGEVIALLAFRDLMCGKPEIIDLWQAHSDGDVVEIHAVTSPMEVSEFSEDDLCSGDDPVPFLDREETVRNGLINGWEKLLPGDRLVWFSASETLTAEHAIFDVIDHCQVISRTWNPKDGPDGFFYLLNDFTQDRIWTKAVAAIDDAMKMSIPRSWAPRESRGEEWAPFGTDHHGAEFWLKKIAPLAKMKRKSGRR